MRSRREFEQLLRTGRRIAQGPLEARYAPAGAGHARLGVIVGRRAAPGAVARNRLKRLLRESFRRRYAALPPCDVLLRVVRPPASEGELRDALEAAWRRIGRDAARC